jgi:hypothetical protein
MSNPGERIPSPGNNNLEANKILEHVSSFTREEALLPTSLESGKRVIILPKDFYQATLDMCEVQKETRGIFLASRTFEGDNKFPVEAILETGYGSSGSVFHDEKKFNAINELLKQNRDKVFAIEFHTHPKHLGSHFHNNFSNLGGHGDVESLKNNVNRNDNYMHVLITPTHFLTFGLSNPKFVVADIDSLSGNQQNTVLRKQEDWMNKYKELQRGS